jgi:TetR/AcrR family transcriptional regulator, transcriptional repressor for nem operon
LGTQAQNPGDTASQVLDVAERFVQSRGFNGFSYADVASELHVTKAALHYHFASKAELGEALIDRYSARFMAALDDLDHRLARTSDRLKGYVALYADVLRDQRMCLCGMLAAEYQTLPRAMQATISTFFDENEAWLERLLKAGKRDGTLHFSGPASIRARLILDALEGAMLVSRPRGQLSRFETTATQLVRELTIGSRVS